MVILHCTSAKKHCTTQNTKKVKFISVSQTHS